MSCGKLPNVACKLTVINNNRLSLLSHEAKLHQQSSTKEAILTDRRIAQMARKVKQVFSKIISNISGKGERSYGHAENCDDAAHRQEAPARRASSAMPCSKLPNVACKVNSFKKAPIEKETFTKIMAENVRIVNKLMEICREKHIGVVPSRG